jgi:hypothetical protein
MRMTHSLPRYSSNTHSRGSTTAAALKACSESRQLLLKLVDARCATLQRAEHSGGVHCTCDELKGRCVCCSKPERQHAVDTITSRLSIDKCRTSSATMQLPVRDTQMCRRRANCGSLTRCESPAASPHKCTCDSSILHIQLPASGTWSKCRRPSCSSSAALSAGLGARRLATSVAASALWRYAASRALTAGTSMPLPPTAVRQMQIQNSVARVSGELSMEPKEHCGQDGLCQLPYILQFGH